MIVIMVMVIGKVMIIVLMVCSFSLGEQHVYVSLSEKQIKLEEEMTRNPLSHPELEVPQTPSEILYQVSLSLLLSSLNWDISLFFLFLPCFLFLI